MNRRGFFGLLGKLVAVGAAMSVSPAILKPVENALKITNGWLWVDAGTLKWGENVWELQADGQFKCVAGKPFEWSVAIDYEKMEYEEFND